MESSRVVAAARIEHGPANKASHDFDYEGWNVKLELDAVHPDGVVSGHADLYEQSVFKCRLMLSGPHHSGSGALQELARKARALIDARRAEDKAWAGDDQASSHRV